MKRHSRDIIYRRFQRNRDRRELVLCMRVFSAQMSYLGPIDPAIKKFPGGYAYTRRCIAVSGFWTQCDQFSESEKKALVEYIRPSHHENYLNNSCSPTTCLVPFRFLNRSDFCIKGFIVCLYQYTSAIMSKVYVGLVAHGHDDDYLLRAPLSTSSSCLTCFLVCSHTN